MSFGFLKSLSGNFDLMRIGGASALLVYPFPYIYEVIAKAIVPDPTSFGTGYALVITAAAAAIGGKELALAKATATTAAQP